MSMGEPPSRPFMVMDDILGNYGCNHNRRSLDWEVVECRRDAVGYEPADKHILDGISLCVLRGDDDDPELYPDMSVRLTDDAFNQVGMMIDDDTADISGRHTSVSCSVCAVEGDAMVMRLAFRAHHVTGPLRAYYLVYDSGNASLSMLPAQAPQFRSIGRSCPLPLRREDGGYTLALLGNRHCPATDGHDSAALCLWSLPPAPSDISQSADMDQWVVKSSHHLNDRSFDAHMAFSCNGNAVWGDLTQGIMYCSYSDLLNGGDDSVNFEYMRLPEKHRIPYHQAMMMGEMRSHRNIGLIGNSIWFVSITQSDGGTGDTMVEVWTLNLTQPLSKEEKMEWETLIVFRMQDIWELDTFDKKGLPKSLPMFPILRQQDDGVLYVLLPNVSTGEGYLVGMIGIDVGRSGGKRPQIVSSRYLAVPWMRRPIVLPLDFFGPRDMV
jgi:hypothetical protein